MARRKSVPGKAVRGGNRKQVRTPPQPGDGKPSWRFSSVDRNGEFAWPAGRTEELDIIEKLHQFDSMEWSDIEGKQHHSIRVEHLSGAARRRLEVIQTDDIEAVFSFRLQGRSRIFCIRDRNIAKLLWYDPEHKVCLSNKKHT